MKKTIVFTLMLVVAASLVVAQADQVEDCQEQTQKVGYVDAGLIRVKYFRRANYDEHFDRCKDYNYLLHYSCKNPHPATPTLIRCPLRCHNGGCLGSYSAVVQQSNYMKDKSATKDKYLGRAYQLRPKSILYEERYPNQYKPFSPTYLCEETDDGDDYATKGTTKAVYSNGAVYENEDYCKDERYLIEYSCAQRSAITPRTIACPLKCDKGACVNKYV
ncbi:MAG: hypothetical protein QW331_01250 [Candidatus Woesearchaeota archaeon]